MKYQEIIAVVGGHYFKMSSVDSVYREGDEVGIGLRGCWTSVKPAHDVDLTVRCLAGCMGLDVHPDKVHIEATCNGLAEVDVDATVAKWTKEQE